MPEIMLFQQHSLESKFTNFHQSFKPIALQFSSNFNELRCLLIYIKIRAKSHAFSATFIRIKT